MHGSECQGKNMSHLWILSQILFVVFGKWDTVLNCHKQGHSQKVLTNGHELWVSDFCITFTCLQLTSACCSHIMPCWARHPTPVGWPHPCTKTKTKHCLDLKPMWTKSNFSSKSAVGCLQSATDVCSLRQPTACLSCRARGQQADCLHILEYTFDTGQ